MLKTYFFDSDLISECRRYSLINWLDFNVKSFRNLSDVRSENRPFPCCDFSTISRTIFKIGLRISEVSGYDVASNRISNFHN